MKQNKKWTDIPPWVFIGAVAILLPIFTVMAVENIHSQKRQSTRLLIEKGAALIRSFEAGTRTGMMGMQWSTRHLQRLLTETAQQPDIAYLLVTGKNGVILAHDDPKFIGKFHGRDIDLNRLSENGKLHWRVVRRSNGGEIFEVFRKFSPTTSPFGLRHGPMMMLDRLPFSPDELEMGNPSPQIIFVGLKMASVEEARAADMRHTIVMAAILLLAGFAGIIFLFLAQGYRSTRASLSRIKAFSDNLVENMPIGLLAMDPQGRIVAVNQAASSILQLSPKTTVDMNADEVLPADLLADIKGTTAGPIVKEAEYPFSDGTHVPIDLIASELKDADGIFLGHMIIIRDLSELRRLKKEIARHQRLAAVGRLASGVAHEIRNPLSSIKGFATYFKERYREIPEDQQIADIMIQEVDRLNRVVGQLLEFSRPISIAKKSVNIDRLIDNSVKLVQQKAAQAGIRIQTRIDPAVKTAHLDPDRIDQVLLNLYLNAIEAMHSGGSLTIEVFPQPSADLITIRIADTGIGIEQEDLSHIFDPYYTTKPSGTGLGLAIVHNVLEAHGGEIQVNSEYGHGTEIFLSLPDTQEEEPKHEMQAVHTGRR